MHLAHARHYSALVEGLGPRLYNGSAERRLLQFELENIDLACSTLIARLPAAEAIQGLRPLAQWMGVYFDQASAFMDQARFHARLVAAVSAYPSDELQMFALISHGWALYRLGESEQARESLSQGLELAERIGQPEEIARAQSCLSMVEILLGNYERASELNHSALAIAREISNLRRASMALATLGQIEAMQDRYGEAAVHWEQALAICRESGDRNGMATLQNYLGLAAQRRGDTAAAREHFGQSLELYREIGYRSGVALALGNIGGMAYIEGDLERAAEQLAEAVEISREVGDRAVMCFPLRASATVAYLRGNLAFARPLAEKALAISTEIGDRRGIAQAQAQCSLMSADVGDLPKAKALCTDALAEFLELRDVQAVVETIAAAGRLLALSGMTADAAVCLAAVQEQTRLIGFELEPLERKLLEDGIALLEQGTVNGEFPKPAEADKQFSLRELAAFTQTALEKLQTTMSA